MDWKLQTKQNNILDQLARLTGQQLDTFGNISKFEWLAIIKNSRE